MKTVKGFAVLFLCLLFGHFTRDMIDFPIPEAVYGMVYFFILLILKAVRVGGMEGSCKLLLDNMTIFFIPLGARFLENMDLIGRLILPIVVILLVSTALTMAVTAKAVELVQKRRKPL